MNKHLKITAFVLLWAVCGYGAWGLSLGLGTRLFPADDHRGLATFGAAAGPFGLMAVTIVSGIATTHLYWRVTPLTVEERWEAFHKRFPSLDREYFDENYNR